MVDEPNRRGRPEYEPTEDDRAKVRVLKGCGMTREAIAKTLGICAKTLGKHFSTELKDATAHVTAELLLVRYQAAMAGNVSAQNRMLEHLGIAGEKGQTAKAEPKGGKKEERQAAAEKVGGKFATPAPPKAKK